MIRAPRVVRIKRQSKTWRADSRRASHFERLVRDKLAELFAETPEEDRAGLSRAIVQEAVRADANIRGEHEARAWAAKQAGAAA